VSVGIAGVSVGARVKSGVFVGGGRRVSVGNEAEVEVADTSRRLMVGLIFCAGVGVGVVVTAALKVTVG
jgi:hypothetical protein